MMIRSVVVSMLPLLTRSPTEAAKGIYRNLAKRCQLNWKDRGCQWYTPCIPPAADGAAYSRLEATGANSP
jgi:hypothetical protein